MAGNLKFKWPEFLIKMAEISNGGRNNENGENSRLKL